MNSKVMMIVGILLVLAGGLVLYFGGIPQETESIRIGSASIGYTETKTVPDWVSGLALGAGAILFIVGFTGKK